MAAATAAESIHGRPKSPRKAQHGPDLRAYERGGLPDPPGSPRHDVAHLIVDCLDPPSHVVEVIEHRVDALDNGVQGLATQKFHSRAGAAIRDQSSDGGT